jgi:outer membrane protein OmpA-like peptidoglycan-associated protein
MLRNGLFFAVSFGLSTVAAAQESAPRPRSGGALPLVYTGSDARVGLGVNQDGEVHGEARGVFGLDGRRAFLAEGWLGPEGAGGVAFGYHWLRGGRDPHAGVWKLLLAADRNMFDDRKATLGFGIERRGGEVGLTYSHALSDERLIDSDLASDSETLTGVIDGRVFQQIITTDTLTELFEHPYEHGLGLRVGRFFDNGLLRLRAGLDYERGEALLAGDEASQLAASVGIEKYFANSGHSVALDVEHARRDGPFDDGRDDTRATLLWRYEFGQPFRAVAAEVVPAVAVERAPASSAPPALVRNEVELSAEALFALDRAELTDTASADLRPLLDALKTRRVGIVEIVGHTCDLGSDDYNRALSERRAMAVHDWLVSEGVPAEALLASGAGESAPAVANDSESNRARNRRVELRFVTAEETLTPTPLPAPAPAAPAAIATPDDDGWIDRALRNLPAHKRSVDSYRIRRVTETRNEGPIEFLNSAPDAVDDGASAQAGVEQNIAVLANDSDPDGDALAVSAITQGANGTVALLPGGSVTYTANPDFTGTDAFTYTVRDPGGLTDTATVTVTVEATQNNAPVAVDDTAQTQTDIDVVIAVLANDSDDDGDALTVTAVSDPANGDAVLQPDGTIVYDSDAGFTGNDTFTYSIDDGNGGSDTATVIVTVAAANQPPIAEDDTATVASGNAVGIDVLANDSDPEGTALAVSTFTNGGNGTVSREGGGLIYTPAAGFAGTDTFTYTVIDADGLIDTATVTVTVTGGNEPPIAVDDAAQTEVGTPTFIGVRDNDSDPDGDALLVTAVTQPANGSVSIVSAGSGVVYVPNAGFSGTDTFTYTIDDGNGGTATATVTVQVAAPNRPPIAVDDVAQTVEGAAVVISVLANDSDPDGDTLSFNALLAVPANGDVVDNGDGTLTYTPDPGFIGTDTFAYNNDDGRGTRQSLSNAATVTVEVIAAPNQPPVANADSATTEQDTPVTIDVIGNDSDPEGDPITVTGIIDGTPGNGSAVVNTFGFVVYTPNPDFVGQDTFFYAINDGSSESVGQVTVTVTPPVNQAPIARDDAVNTPQGTPIDIPVLANDNDPDGDAFFINGLGAPANGTLVNHPDGVLTYTPDPAFIGTESFTYSITDGNGGDAGATVTVTVFQIP